MTRSGRRSPIPQPTSERTEAAFQAKLVKEYKADGWYVIRLLRTSIAGLPDLLLCHPDRGILFVEVKASRGRLSPIQEHRIQELRDLGFSVEVVKDQSSV